MKYLKVFDDYEAELLIRNGHAEEIGPYQALVEENIKYALNTMNVSKEEDIEFMTKYVSDNWEEIEIDEQNIQDQIIDLVFEEMDGE